MPASPSPPSDDSAAALAQWRAAHPQATLAEIERAVDAHLSAYRAALITRVATDPAPAERPLCPDCGTPVQQVGARSRRRRTAHGGELTFRDPAYRCPACGAGLFPPD